MDVDKINCVGDYGSIKDYIFRTFPGAQIRDFDSNVGWDARFYCCCIASFVQLAFDHFHNVVVFLVSGSFCSRAPLDHVPQMSGF